MTSTCLMASIEHQRLHKAGFQKSVEPTEPFLCPHQGPRIGVVHGYSSTSKEF